MPARAAGWGPRQKGVIQGPAAEKGVIQGRAALVAALPGAKQPSGGGHPVEVPVRFTAYPPCAHFRRPW